MTRRILVPAVVGLVLISMAGCKRDSDQLANGASTSAFFDNATPEAREALAIQVDYRLTDENFARWETAQRNLDRLPGSAFPQRSGTGRNVIDRAVARLEASPKARTTIEATGLTVRDFVLQTIALAQATEATQSGRPAGAGIVPPENFRFVERHRERVGRAQIAARNASRRARSADIEAEFRDADTVMEGVTGIAESSDTLVFPVPEPVQPPRDSAQSGANPLGEPPQRDTASDSLSLSPGY